MLKRKDEQMATLQQQNEQLNLVVGQLEQDQATKRFYDEQLREKEHQYRELQKVQEKVHIGSAQKRCEGPFIPSIGFSRKL